jgi:protease-4
MIRDTAEEEGVQAIVLRIDSGGGSMFASEVIREQVRYARDSGIPLVVSMGSVAASGGYYIAADADEIWATPATITGSIGVYAAFPTFEKLLKRVGISTDGVGTNVMAGSLRADRALSPEVKAVIDSSVDYAYSTFLQVVAGGRDLTVEQVQPLAEGRVWASADALDAGLVDKLGSLEDAIASAAELAGMSDYEVDYVEMPLSPREMLMKQLAKRVGGIGLLRDAPLSSALGRWLAPVQQAAEELSILQDPRDLYLRCLDCGVAP